MNDVRFVKGGVARAIRTLRAATTSGAGRSGGAAVAADGGVAVHGRRRGTRVSTAG